MWRLLKAFESFPLSSDFVGLNDFSKHQSDFLSEQSEILSQSSSWLMIFGDVKDFFALTPFFKILSQAGCLLCITASCLCRTMNRPHSTFPFQIPGMEMTLTTGNDSHKKSTHLKYLPRLEKKPPASHQTQFLFWVLLAVLLTYHSIIYVTHWFFFLDYSRFSKIIDNAIVFMFI